MQKISLYRSKFIKRHLITKYCFENLSYLLRRIYKCNNDHIIYFSVMFTVISLTISLVNEDFLEGKSISKQIIFLIMILLKFRYKTI